MIIDASGVERYTSQFADCLVAEWEIVIVSFLCPLLLLGCARTAGSTGSFTRCENILSGQPRASRLAGSCLLYSSQLTLLPSSLDNLGCYAPVVDRAMR